MIVVKLEVITPAESFKIFGDILSRHVALRVRMDVKNYFGDIVDFRHGITWSVVGCWCLYALCQSFSQVKTNFTEKM